jgi:hypothetical protein
MKRIITLVGLVISLGVCHVQAGTIYANGTSYITGATAVSYALSSDDFILTEPSIITAATISLYGSVWSSSGEWGIFSDASGSPGTLLGTGLTLNTQITGTNLYGLQLYFELDNEFNAEADTSYWFSYHTERTSSGWLGVSDVLGSTSAMIPPSGLLGHSFPLMNAFSDSSLWENSPRFDSAFQLHGAPVPEPSSIFLLFTGLTGLAYIVQRRKKE